MRGVDRRPVSSTSASLNLLVLDKNMLLHLVITFYYLILFQGQALNIFFLCCHGVGVVLQNILLF